MLDYFYPVSDVPITAGDLAQGVTAEILEAGESYPFSAEECIELAPGVILIAETIWAIAEDNASLEVNGETIVFPKAGIYVPIDLLFTPVRITINGFGRFFCYKPIDKKYIPPLGYATKMDLGAYQLAGNAVGTKDANGGEKFNGALSASGDKAHAEGGQTIASGRFAHAEGRLSIASGYCSHAEGCNTYVTGLTITGSANATTYTIDSANELVKAGQVILHNDAYATITDYNSSALTITLDRTVSTTELSGIGVSVFGGGASGYCSHVEGDQSVASGDCAHAEGRNTIASGADQHVQGRYNIEDTANKYAHIVGNGTSMVNRSNAHTLDWDGNAWFAGGIELTSPNGTRYRFTVTDDGTLTSEVVTG